MHCTSPLPQGPKDPHHYSAIPARRELRRLGGGRAHHHRLSWNRLPHVPHPQLLTFFLHVNNKLQPFHSLCLQLSSVPTCFFPAARRRHPSRWPRDCQLFKKHQGPLLPVDTPRPSLHLPVYQSKGCCRETPQLPSQQTDEPLCPGSWLPRKPPISFPVGLAAGASPFSGVSQSRSHQATHCFLRTCLEPLIMVSDPLSGAVPQQEAWGLGDLPPSPRRGLPDKSAAGARTEHLPTLPCCPDSSGQCLHTALRSTSLVCHTHTLSFLASGRCPFPSGWGL